MNLVLDASLSLAWLFERTDKKESKRAELALDAISKCDTYVPILWHTEITNALLVAERRSIITEAQSIDYLTRLLKLPITTDDILISKRREVIMALAREQNLTTYDATYLDLALRLNANLATFDSKLAHAMHRIGGKVF